MPTPATSFLPPPKSDDEFEDIILDIFKLKWDDPHVQRYGRSGQAQEGVDLYGRPAYLAGQYSGIQCKLRNRGKLTATIIDKEISKAEKFKPPLKEYIIATTQPRDAALQKYARKINEAREKAGLFSVQLYFWDDAQGDLTHHDNQELLVTHYQYIFRLAEQFGPISDKARDRQEQINTRQDHPPLREFHLDQQRMESPVLNQTEETTYSRISSSDFAGTLEESVSFNEMVESIRNLLREGSLAEANAAIRRIRANSDLWESMKARDQAALLRLEAAYLLDTSRDTVKARSLAAQAASIYSDEPKDLRLEALLLRHEGDSAAALEMLSKGSDLASLNSLAAMYLDQGRLDEATKVIDRISKEEDPNPETHRLSAIIAILYKDLKEAERSIKNAEIEGGNWWSVRLTAEIIKYFHTIDSSAIQDSQLAWPEPINASFVYIDSDSVQNRNAVTSNLEQIEHLFPDTFQEDIVRGWRLATMLLLPDRDAEAGQLAIEMLARDPTDARVLAWALAGFIEIDVSNSVTELRKLLDAQTANIIQIDSLVGCIGVLENKPREALDILEETKEFYLKRDDEDIWKLRKIQMLLADDDLSAAEDLQATILDADISRHTAGLILGAQGEDPDKRVELATLLEGMYEEENDISALLQAIEVQMRYQEWDWVADRAEKILDVVPTGKVVSIVANATYYSGRFGQCLNIFIDYQDSFSKNQLPINLRRMKAHCLLETGALEDAINEFQEIYVHTRTSMDMGNLAFASYRAGDRHTLTRVAEELEHQPDVDPALAVDLARLVRNYDNQLAQRLFRKGMQQELPDDLIGNYFMTGHALKLDLENELDPLYPRIRELAQVGAAGFMSMDIDRLRELAAQRTITPYDLYLQGSVPIHFFATKSNTPLAFLFHTSLLQNEARLQPYQQLPVMALHGSRRISIDCQEQLEIGRLFVDISALLLAHHFEFLDFVEEKLAPLYVTPEVLAIISELANEVQHHQPSTFDRARELLAILDQGRMNSFSVGAGGGNQFTFTAPKQLEEAALANEAFIVEFRNAWDQYSEEITDQLVDVPTLIHALHGAGELTADQVEVALENSGEAQVAKFESTMLPKGAKLFFAGPIINTVASAEILAILVDHFRVFLPADYIRHLRLLLQYEDQIDETSEWLSGLLDRIRAGLRVGTYKFLEALPGQGDLIVEKEYMPDYGLMTFLRAVMEAGDYVWIDDRFTNCYEKIVQTPILTCLDILQTLLCGDVLSKKDYFDILLRMRAANIRHIPLQADEILYHLNRLTTLEDAQAPNRLEESRALRILRRYYAATFIPGVIIQHPNNQKGAQKEHNFNEINYLLQSSTAVSHAVLRIWGNDSLTETQRLRYSDWCLSSLYIDLNGFSDLIGIDAPTEERTAWVAASISDLLQNAMFLSWKSKQESASRQSQYISWINDVLLRHSLWPDQNLFNAVVKQLLVFIRVFIERDELDLSRDERIHIVGKYLEALPDQIKDELAKTPFLIEALGILEIVEVHGQRFDLKVFWETLLALAESGTHQELSSNSGQVIYFTLTRTDDVQVLPAMRVSDEEEPLIITGVGFPLLSGKDEHWQKYLNDHRDWFEVSDVGFQKILEGVLADNDPISRAQTVVNWRSTRLYEFYEGLRQRIEKRAEIEHEKLFALDFSSFERHYRITREVLAEKEFSEAIQSGALELIETVGLDEAIYRYSTLPVGLPEAILEAFDQLSDEHKQGLTQRLSRYPVSPVRGAHLLHLLMRRAADTSAQFTEQYLKENPYFATFTSLLGWVQRQFSQMEELQLAPNSFRLLVLWAHTQYLLDTFISQRVDPKWLESYFGIILPSAYDAFEVDNKIDQDVCYPRNLNHIQVQVIGLAYAVNGYEDQIDEGTKSAILNISTLVQEDTRIPHPALSLDVQSGQNELGSYLGESQDKMLEELLGEEIAALFGQETHQQLSLTIIEALGKEPNSLQGWQYLHGLLGHFPANRVVFEAFRDFAGSFEFADFIGLEPLVGMHAYRVTASIAEISEINEVKNALKNEVEPILLELSRLYPMQVPDTEDYALVVSLLAGAVYSLSLDSREEGGSLQAFAELLEKVATLWPRAVRDYQAMVLAICEFSHPDRLQSLWKLLTHIRSVG